MSLPLVGLAVGPASSAAGAPSAVLTATTYPAMDSVVIQNPLPNFTAAAPGPTNGALTAAELGALSSDPQKAEGQFNLLAKQAGFGAYLRLWTDANGPGRGANDIVITLYRIPNSQDANSFASGSQKPYQQPGAAASFAVPSIPGAHGYTVSISSPSQVNEQVVLFKSDPYVAIVQLASSVAATNPAPLNPSDAISVSFQQYSTIRHALATQTAGAPSGTPSATAKPGSVLPAVVAVIAGLVVVAVVAWTAAGPPRARRRRRRAALFAASHEPAVRAPIDVPVAETRPVRLARGPVIRVVEVEPRTGAAVSPPRSGPAKAEPRPMPAVSRGPEPTWPAAGRRTEPEPTTEPTIEPAVAGVQPVEPDPGAGVGPKANPDFGPEPSVDTETEYWSEPVPELHQPRAAEPWLDVRPEAEPEPTIDPGFDPISAPDLEELELAESAAAELAAHELAKLGGLVEAAESGAGPEAVPDRFVDPLVGQVAPNHRSTWTPGGPVPGSAATPVGKFDDPVAGTPAGWLPDPSGLPDVLRYWDGHAWTFRVATRSTKR